MRVLTIAESLVLLDVLTRDLTVRDRGLVRRCYLIGSATLVDALAYADWIRERRGPSYTVDRHEASALVLD